MHMSQVGEVMIRTLHSWGYHLAMRYGMVWL